MVAIKLGEGEVRANLMHEDKVAAIEELKKQGYLVAMIVMETTMRRHWLEQMLVLRWAGCGTQAVLEATNIVLMADDL